MKKVLFACYGSGHVRMVVPVAKALQASGRAEVAVLGLTTAASVVRQAGLPSLQFKDFVRGEDAAHVERGRELVRGLGDVNDPEESAAYLGFSYADLEAEVGSDEAALRYARQGRQAFFPRRTVERIVREVNPDLVVATNSPRAERAAIVAAKSLGIPAVCIVDLFAIDEVRWIGEPGYADRVCVLNESVRRFLIEAGRDEAEVVATGNPAFDVLLDPATLDAGRALRAKQGWEGKRVVLWPAQDEPAVHPFDGRAGDPSLPIRVLDALLAWTRHEPDAVLCIRPRAGQALPQFGEDRVMVTGQDWPLAPLLHAVDVVVTLTSTVGLEGHLAGARLVQIQGSVFDAAMPLARFGIADEAVPLQRLGEALDRVSRLGRRASLPAGTSATGQVLQVIGEFL
jgi:hypothetical protein